jgi:hypothetical protein
MQESSLSKFIDTQLRKNPQFKLKFKFFIPETS